MHRGAWEWVTQFEMGMEWMDLGRYLNGQDGRSRKSILLLQREWSLQLPKEHCRRSAVHDALPMNLKHMWTFDNNKQTTIAVFWLLLMARTVFSIMIHWSPYSQYLKKKKCLYLEKGLLQLLFVKLRWVHTRVAWTLIPVSHISLQAEETWTQRHSGEMATRRHKDTQRESLVTMEAEISMIYLLARECQAFWWSS